MKKLLLFCLMVALIPAVGYSAEIKVGEKLPNLVIQGDNGGNNGMMNAQGDEYTFSKFDSNELIGKVRSILILAAVKDNDLVNKPFVDAIKAETFSPEHYQTVSIIDFDQANFFTRPIGEKRSRNKQKEFPNSSYVWDQDGETIKEWSLNKRGYTVVVIDKDNNVLKIKDGKLSDTEIEDFIKAIKDNL